MIGIIVIPTTLSQENVASMEEKRTQDLVKLEKIIKYGQYGLEVQLAYELELGGQYLGAYIENFRTSLSLHTSVEEFLNKTFSKEYKYDGLLQQLIVERYPTRGNMQILKRKHPDAFLKLTQGLNTQEVDAWLRGGEVSHIILPGPQEADKVQENFKILGPDGKPAEKKPFLIEPASNNAFDLTKTQAGLYIPQTIISPTTSENNFSITKNKVDIGVEISKRWNNYPKLERSKLIEFDLLRRDQKGWLVQYLKPTISDKNTSRKIAWLLWNLKNKPPSWMINTNDPHWDRSMLEIETKGKLDDRSQFRKEFSQVTDTLGLRDKLSRPLDDASPDHSLHLNISVKDYPPDKLITFLTYYQDIMLGRILNNEKKHVRAFGFKTVAYHKNLHERGLLRLKNSLLGYFEIRTQTKGPEETLDEVLKFLADMKNNETETVERMKNDVRKLLTPKFFEEMLTSTGLKEEINILNEDENIEKDSQAYQDRLERIKAVNAVLQTRKYDALNDILLRYTGTNMEQLQNKYADLVPFDLDDNQSREKLFELTKKPNFSLDNLIIDYSDFLETRIGEYFKGSPMTRLHADKILQGLWGQIPIDAQIEIFKEYKISNFLSQANFFEQSYKFDKKIIDTIVEIIVISPIENALKYLELLSQTTTTLDADQLKKLSSVLLKDSTEQNRRLHNRVLSLISYNENLHTSELLNRVYTWWRKNPTPSPPHNLVELLYILRQYSPVEDVMSLLKKEIDNIPNEKLLKILETATQSLNRKFSQTIAEAMLQATIKEARDQNRPLSAEIINLLNKMPALEKIYPEKMKHVLELQEIIHAPSIINQYKTAAIQKLVNTNTYSLEQLVNLIDTEFSHAAQQIISAQPYSIAKLLLLNKNNLDGLKVKEVNEFIVDILAAKDSRRIFQGISFLENSSQIPKESIDYLVQLLETDFLFQHQLRFYANSKLEDKFKISPSYKEKSAKALNSFKEFLSAYESGSKTTSFLEGTLPLSAMSENFVNTFFEIIGRNSYSLLDFIPYFRENYLPNNLSAQKKLAGIMNAKDLSNPVYTVERQLQLTSGWCHLTV